jgi:hypothetical protein
MPIRLLRQLLAGLPDVTDARSAALPPDELRFILEYDAEPQLETERARVAELLGSGNFVLARLAGEGPLARFLALRFPAIGRVLPQSSLFALAYAIADALDLASCEPDLGSDFYQDPVPQPEGPRLETASVLQGLCLADPPAPPDRRWALRAARIDGAWARGRGAGILIGHPDTGFARHAELEEGMLRIDLGANILDGGTNPEDPLRAGTANPGHGTATSSVAASRDRGEIWGAAPDSALVPIRCIEDVKIFNAAPVAAAIAHAVRVGCHVISMSLGGVPSRALHAAVMQAVEADLIVVAAAGNCVRTVVWPARYDEVIAVAGCNAADAPWKGSCRGSAVDITAPAEWVWRAERARASDPLTGVAAGQGTSFATALVAGAAALWLSRHDRAAALAEARRRGVSLQRLFRTALRATARRPAGWRTGSFGAGILDAKALLDLELAAIPAIGAERAGERNSFVRMLDEEIAPGPADPAFAWDRYGMEVGTIVLTQAKRGGRAAELSIEGKSAGTQPSPQLSDAALASPDPRLTRFAAVPGRTGFARPPVVLDRPPRVDLAVTRRGTGLEGTAGPLDGPRLKAYLRDKGHAEQMRHVERVLADLPSRDEQAKTLVAASAHAALDHLAGRRPPSTLTRVGLEALVMLTGRPALRVRNDRVDLADPRAAEWHDRLFLAIDGGFLQERFKSVGRIDIDSIHVGTGFVVGPGLVLTNRHVLQAIAAPVPRRDRPDSWVLLSDEITIDFAEEPSSRTAASRFKVKSVIGAGEEEIDEDLIDFSKLDAALLEVESQNGAGTALPGASALVRDQTKAERPRELMVIGYPARPSTLPLDQSGGIDTGVTARLNQLFGTDYGTKYAAPGQVIGIEGWVLKHDATTLGGSSGSCVIGLDTPTQVIGLHFGGHWLKENYAHAVGKVAATDSFLSHEPIEWID